MKRKRKGFTLVELLVVIAIIALLMGILMPALSRVRQIAFRMVCGSNLSGIGRAMLIYANDYDDSFPRAGYVGTVWVDELLSWSAVDRQAAFGYPGGATITSNFYLLVRYAEVTPKSFVCKSESNTTVFKVENYLPGYEDEDVWDFGPGQTTNASYTPTNHCSYSYHMPYNRFFLSTASSEPGLAVAADRNPWLDPDTDTSYFLWDSHEKKFGLTAYQYGNAGPHQREGQNVLFMDNHVYFEKQAFCGIEEDNIYTYDDLAGDQQQGVNPDCTILDGATDQYCQDHPSIKEDSLLINECGIGAAAAPPSGPPSGPPGPP
jgi:prepilin-type N-terminal cleavage/methylation domain-containing protein